MYDQSIEFQSGSSTGGGGGGNDRPTDRPGELPRLKLLSAGNGNNTPLGIFTKSPVILANKGVQRIHEFLLQDQSAKLLPLERVCNCLKKRIDKQKQREVKYNESRKKAHWANVQRCGSVWTCPVCAKQITEKRREELKRLRNMEKRPFRRCFATYPYILPFGERIA